jgi:hypothetical protein
MRPGRDVCHPLLGKGQKVFMAAVMAADPGKAVVKIAAV